MEGSAAVPAIAEKATRKIRRIAVTEVLYIKEATANLFTESYALQRPQSQYRQSNRRVLPSVAKDQNAKKKCHCF